MFPLSLSVISPAAIVILLNYSQPSYFVSQTLNFPIYYNTSKYIIYKTGVIEIITDSSFLAVGKNTNVIFLTSSAYNSETYYDKFVLVNMNFILDPIKILYFRSYRNLQNVLNNVTSAAGALFAIFGNICRPYNAYKLKVDFIEENILFKLDKQAMRENKDIILNLQQNEEFIEPKQHV